MSSKKKKSETKSDLLDTEAKPGRKRRRARGVLLLGVVGLLAVAFNEGLRSKVLDLMFGAEEEFDYSSTTSPATPEPVVAGS